MSIASIAFNLPEISINDIIGLSVTVVLLTLLDFFFYRIFKKVNSLVYVICSEIIIIAAFYFHIDLLFYIALLVFGVCLLTFFFSNLNDIRLFFAKMAHSSVSAFFARSKQKNRPEVIFDREAMYEKIENAVLTMSKQKVGALLTFEKKDSLDQVIKSGTIINAPVSSELIQTIFYPGTRLHDGAVIIRDDKMVAASVYFTPTTRPLTGKFGSRHRAAIGISEVSDAVTVVVSEETGRISIAYDGELQSVPSDLFLKTFEEYMALSKTDEQKKDN